MLKNIGHNIFGAFLIVITVLLPFLKSRFETWGATREEINHALPGDELVPNSRGGYDHAVTIKAPAKRVWPWLLQLGQGRGGFYSYELLENLVGCKMRNVDRLIPGLQKLGVGDKIPMHPKMGVPYRVAEIVPERALVLEIRVNSKTGEVFAPGEKIPETYQNSSWVLYLEESSEGTTRLLSRSRNDYNRSFANTLVFGIFGPVSVVMDRKMLLGIKHRAERF